MTILQCPHCSGTQKGESKFPNSTEKRKRCFHPFRLKQALTYILNVSAQKGSLQKHINEKHRACSSAKHSNEGEGRLQCPSRCEKSYGSQFVLNEHVRSCHVSLNIADLVDFLF